jgi:voltage-gated potassium channel
MRGASPLNGTLCPGKPVNLKKLPSSIRSRILTHVVLISLLLLLLIAIGTAGYHIIENWDWVDCLYMTIITISTVGYREIGPLSPAGKFFTMGLILYSVIMVAYIVGYFTKFLVESEIFLFFGRKKLERQIHNLKDHTIICGFGRIGSLICHELQQSHRPFVIIENDLEIAREIEAHGYLFILGDATSDETLIRAGIRRAKALVTSVETDANNLFITLTARGLNPNLFILSRAGDESTEKKLLLAGASKVVSPYKMGALRMANILLRPAVVDFAETVFQKRGLNLRIEEFPMGPETSLIGTTLRDSRFRERFGIIVVAIKRPSEEMLFNPSPEETLHAGDTLIVLGEPKHLEQFEKVLKQNP